VCKSQDGFLGLDAFFHKYTIFKENTMLQIGITSARPGKSGRQVKREFDEYKKELLYAYPTASVTLGRGGWEGGSEPSFVTYVDGDVIPRETYQFAIKHEQDAFLVIGSGNSSIVSRFMFAEMPNSKQEIEIEDMLLENGVEGWTWEQNRGETILHIAFVAEWSKDSLAMHKLHIQRIQQLVCQKFDAIFVQELADVRPIEKGQY
jgi:hypothetical protein